MNVPTAVEVLDQVTGSYEPDPVHSRLGFAARYAMVTTVHGWFDSFRGQVHLDGQDPSNCSVALTIDAASIRTNNSDRDAHLRSADFFDVERHPTITFESSGVTALDDHHYRVTGDLTIRDVTRAIDLELTHQGNSIDPYGQLRVGFEGSGALKRSDWGLTWNVALETGGIVLSDRINLEFDLSLVKSA
ncbi:MAG TPA: YceI family protein [Acidimicrobiales bacterium]|nr:YceI family protein [Acidimicrobiales bacterium]